MKAWGWVSGACVSGGPAWETVRPLLCAWPWLPHLPTPGTLRLASGPMTTFWGLWVGEGREGFHQCRNLGFLILQNPHSELWSPWPCLA